VKTLMIRVCGTLHRADKRGRNLMAQKTWASQRDFSWVDREEELNLRDILQKNHLVFSRAQIWVFGERSSQKGPRG